MTMTGSACHHSLKRNRCEEGLGKKTGGSQADESAKLHGSHAVAAGGKFFQLDTRRLAQQKLQRGISAENVGPMAEKSTELHPVLEEQSTEADETTKADVDMKDTVPTRTAHPITSVERKLRWMWGDAGVEPLPLSRRLAKLNPFRWSRQQNIKEAIVDLQSWCEGELQDESWARPVRLEIRRQEQSDVVVFTSLIKALSHLSDLERSP
jgi:hypothetical protein